MEGEHDIARRTVLVSAGVGIGAGLVSGLSSAQAEGATPAAASAEIWSSEYWANKGGVKLNLWRKRAGAPKPGEKPLPILFLVHGSTFSCRGSTNLRVSASNAPVTRIGASATLVRVAGASSVHTSPKRVGSSRRT